MIKSIKKRIKNNGKLVESISYLTILQVFTAAVPIITFPYLIRILGNELYGTVIYVQVIMSYFSLLLDGGFKNSAAKDISVHRKNEEKLSEIMSSVLSIRITIWLILLLLLVTTVNVFSAFKDLKYLYLFSFGYTLNELLLPQFYFLGMERMKYITILNVVVKVVFVLLMLLLIKEQADYLMVPLLHTFGFLIGGGIGLYIIFVRDKIKFKRQSYSTIKKYLVESFPLLATTLVASIKDKFNIILIGNYLGMTDVVIYDLGMKLVALLNKPLEIVNTALFPKMAREKNIVTVKSLMKFSFLLITLVIIIIQLPLFSLVSFLSDNSINNILPIRLLLVIPVIMSISVVLSKNFIIAFGFYKVLLRIMTYTSIFYCILIGIGIISGKMNDFFILILIVIASYFFEMILRYFAFTKLSKTL